MPVIRIKELAARLVKEEAVKKDRSETWVASKAIEKALKPRGPQLKKPKTDPHPLFNDMRQAYKDAWLQNNKFEYKWNGVIDATALHRLIHSLENINQSDESIVDLFKIILDKMPEFWHDKSINALNKNLNGIIASIKKGTGLGSWNSIKPEHDWRV
jgi:hypothetical protein